MSKNYLTKIIKASVLASSLAVTGLVFAQTVPPPSVSATANVNAASSKIREEVKNEVKQKVEETVDKLKNLRDERKAQVEQKLQEIKTKYQENRAARVAAYVEKIISRHNAAANRLDELAKRIEAHLTKLETKKIKTAEARNLLVTAETKIQTAKDAIAKIKPASDTALLATNMKVAFDATKKEISAANQTLKDAHAALVDVINSIKPGLNKTATTTPSESD